eukprot:gene12074-2668_t
MATEMAQDGSEMATVMATGMAAESRRMVRDGRGMAGDGHRDGCRDGHRDGCKDATGMATEMAPG